MELNKDKLIVNLQQNVNKLKSLYEQAKLDKESLFSERKVIEEKFNNTENKYNELEQKINSLKMAKAVLSTTDDVSEAKQRINILVREIDKCISLLNK